MTEKRFTDFWVCETGEVGLDDYGVEKRFTSSEFEDFLNELNPAKQCDGENRLFIKADVSYSDRWLYPSDVFRKEKNLNIALPNEREFMTGECIVTDKDDTAYSIDELVNLLNYFNRCTVSNKEFMELKEENEQLKQYAQTSKEFTEYVEDFFKKYDIDTVNFNALGEMIDADNFFYGKSLKLEKENEQLKQTNQELNDELQETMGYLSLKSGIERENEQLKQQLKEFEDYVYSDEKILCYTCVNCLSKGIYEVECSEKGKVDVHGSCFSYWENELKGDVE